MMTTSILDEVSAERVRQDAKWGEQNHPIVGLYPHRHCISSANDARATCDQAASLNKLSWAHILIEELAEVVESDNEAHAREELIQLAAVCVAAVEAIDRRKTPIK